MKPLGIFGSFEKEAPTLHCKGTQLRSLDKYVLSRTNPMRSIEQLVNFFRTHKFSAVQVAHLDRTKGKANRADAKAFAAKVDATLTGFQDSDVLLVALTVAHKR